MNEADTCRKYVVPKLTEAGWDNEPHLIAEQRYFTDGRIVVAGNKAKRRPQKRADYLLRFTRDFTIAVVEAKPSYTTPGDGLQQPKEYAEILALPFAYATNGHGIVEFDYLTGQERLLDTFRTPDELWGRLQASQGMSPAVAERLLTPSYRSGSKVSRYYQEIAINRTVQALLQGKRRVLLTMATGTGKTLVAFQICWKLWNARWNRTGEYRRPKILYLADRNILIDDPKDKDFGPFGDARHKIEYGQAVKSREMYFAIYQALAKDERRPGLYREYARDFFDLIVIDECHRGSARDESNWREILEWFEPAYQLGMTATPLREDNRDTYRYFGNPLYQYSLKQGIDDGFLAPYRVHRVITTADAAGWRPNQGERVVKFTDYTAEKVRTLYPSAADLRARWADPGQRSEIIASLQERGIDFDELASASNQPDADPFDLLCHIAFNAPLRTRRERAERLQKEKKELFDQYGPEARAILNELLEKYAEHGTAQFVLPDVLEVPPLNAHGNVMEIAAMFGGVDKLSKAVHGLQTLLYAA